MTSATTFASLFKSQAVAPCVAATKPNSVVNGILQFHMNDLRELYSKFTLQRAKMSYIQFNTKCQFIDRVINIDPERGMELRNMFNYDSTVKQRDFYQTTLESYARLMQLHDICAKVQGKSVSYHVRESIITHLQLYPELSCLASYTTDMAAITIAIISNMMNEAKTLAAIQLSEVDNWIPCAYHVAIKRQDPGVIEPLGLSTNIYLVFSNDIDNMYMIPEIEHPDVQLARTNEEWRSLFEYSSALMFQDETAGSYFISIRNDDIVKNIRIDFDIDELLLPSIQELQIQGRSPKSTILSGFMKMNCDNYDLPVQPRIKNKSQHELWLNKISRTSKPNHLQLGKFHSDRNIRTNKFTVDHIFDALLAEDPEHTVIRPNMLDSFRKMAYKYSRK